MTGKLRPDLERLVYELENGHWEHYGRGWVPATAEEKAQAAKIRAQAGTARKSPPPGRAQAAPGRSKHPG
jgi:hypothetical protein